MEIEQFIAQSAGKWRSMRSTHSLAFQQFEQVISHISIQLLDTNQPDVLDILDSNPTPKSKPGTPFKRSLMKNTSLLPP